MQYRVHATQIFVKVYKLQKICTKQLTKQTKISANHMQMLKLIKNKSMKSLDVVSNIKNYAVI